MKLFILFVKIGNITFKLSSMLESQCPRSSAG